MKLKNRFSEEDKIRVWQYHQYCGLCRSNEMCSLHHIIGTKSSSILNSIMLCFKCHKYADGHNVSDKEFQQKLIDYTSRHIKSFDYILKDNDIKFKNDTKGN